jgi:hypothetical protein
MGRPMQVDLTELHDVVLRVIRAAPDPVSVAEIRDLAGTDPPPAEHHVRRLIAQLAAECLIKSKREVRNTTVNGQACFAAPRFVYSPVIPTEVEER